MTTILEPHEVALLMAQLTPEEEGEMVRYVEAGERFRPDSEEEARQFCLRTSEWLTRWRAGKQGGGIG